MLLFIGRVFMVDFCHLIPIIELFTDRDKVIKTKKICSFINQLFWSLLGVD